MFTISDVTGRIIGFGGRTLAGDDAKYINSPATALFDKSNALFGLDQARHKIVSTDTAIVVEGYTDCIMAHQFGITNVVATLGTSFTAGHARILRRYAKKVVLLFDSDVAGIEAANRALQVALGSRIDIAMANVPEGKDPCDFLLAKGKDPFDRLIENATDVFLFKWNRLIDNLGEQSTIAGQKQAVEEYLDAVATAASAGNLSSIERGLIINRISGIMAIDAREITTELVRRTSRAKTSSAYSGSGAQQPPLDLGEGLSANAQREILEVLLTEPRLFAEVKGKISPQSFDVPVLNQIAKAVFETLCEKPQATVQDICSRIEEPQLAGVIVTLEQAGAQKENFRQRLADSLMIIEQLDCKKTKKNINAGDGRNFIRSICENTTKQDPRNVGMV